MLQGLWLYLLGGAWFSDENEARLKIFTFVELDCEVSRLGRIAGHGFELKLKWLLFKGAKVGLFFFGVFV